MFLDTSLITPVRESSPDLGPKRRRQERGNARKVRPGDRGQRSGDEGEPEEQPKGRSLSAYV